MGNLKLTQKQKEMILEMRSNPDLFVNCQKMDIKFYFKGKTLPYPKTSSLLYHSKLFVSVRDGLARTKWYLSELGKTIDL